MYLRENWSDLLRKALRGAKLRRKGRSVPEELLGGSDAEKKNQSGDHERERT